jgi:hypothetical protein
MSNIAEISRVERAEAHDAAAVDAVVTPDLPDLSDSMEAGPPANDTGPAVVSPDKPAPGTRRSRRTDESEQAKRSFATIMEEADVAIRVFDQEKRRILGITYALSQIEQSFGQLFAKFEELERRVEVSAASDNDLRARFEASIESIRTRDDREAELLKDNFTLRAALTNVERQLAQQADDIRSLSDDNAALLQKIGAMEYDTGLILDEIGHLRDDITVLSASEATAPASTPPVKTAAAPGGSRRNEVRAVDAAPAALPVPAAPPRREPESVVADPNGIDAVMGDISSSIAFHMSEAEKLRAKIENLRLAGETAAAPPQPAALPAHVPAPAPEPAAGDHELIDLKSLLKSYQDVIRDLDLSRGAFLRQSEAASVAPAPVVPAAVVSPPPPPAVRNSADGSANRAGTPPAGDIAASDPNGELQHERHERRLAEGALRTARQERAQLQRELARIRAASSRMMQAEADIAVTMRPKPGEKPAPAKAP